MTAVPATRRQQEEYVTLESADAFVRITLPDGRVAVIYGSGELNVVLGVQTRYHRLPTGDDPAPTRRPTDSGRARARRR